ncbi:hypothetical protein DFH08DRAFT_937588 [Mycena albidolilacea]|uniref:Uncharacterized protein n=1 Tax=Mycena albidolilacea TaxID=1033008 RepID=A0AAD7ERU3_9AGAR|nr:hypothetical protein DFH08DRAFT_937588 [Mycena albidolilacea]
MRAPKLHTTRTCPGYALFSPLCHNVGIARRRTIVRRHLAQTLLHPSQEIWRDAVDGTRARKHERHRRLSLRRRCRVTRAQTSLSAIVWAQFPWLAANDARGRGAAAARPGGPLDRIDYGRNTRKPEDHDHLQPRGREPEQRQRGMRRDIAFGRALYPSMPVHVRLDEEGKRSTRKPRCTRAGTEVNEARGGRARKRLVHRRGRRTTSASTREFCNTGVSLRSWKARRLREYARISIQTKPPFVEQKPRESAQFHAGKGRMEQAMIGVKNVKVKQQRAQNVVWAPNRKEVKGRPIILLTTRGTVTQPLSALSRHLPMGIPCLRSSPTEIKVLARNQGSAYCGTLSSGGGQAQHSKIKIS